LFGSTLAGAEALEELRPEAVGYY